MHPYLFDWVVNGYHLRPPSYGIFLALAFSFAYFESLRRAALLEEETRHVENLFLLVVLSAVFGSRLFHVLFEEFSYYRANPSKIFAIWEGGYTFYGAMLLAMFSIFAYCHIKKINFLQFGDIAAPATALGLFFGRIGCFLAGCCWGIPTKMPWGVVFSHPDSFTTNHIVALHPTQLYEAFSGLIIFFYLLWKFKHRKYVGQIFFQGLMLYSVARFMIEFFRGDDYRGYVFDGALSYSQLVSLVIFPFTIVGMFLYSRVRPAR